MKIEELNSKEIFTWAEERISRKRFPLPSQPKTPELEEYEYPVDPSRLSGPELGQWLQRMYAWFGYGQRLLGLAESELVTVEAEYKLKVNTESLRIRDNLSGRPSADLVEAAVLQENEYLVALLKRKLELTTIRTELESRLKIYDIQGRALSRELTRRGQEDDFR